MALREIIMQGWSKRRSDCHVSLHANSNYRDEMIIANGLILGTEKWKFRARGTVFFSGRKLAVTSTLQVG